MDKVRLGSVMTLHRGYDLPNAQRKPGNVPVISSSGISGSHSIAKLDGENVITGRYGTIGEVFYHSGPCWPLNTTLFVEDFHGNDPKYVAYLLEVMLNALQIDGTDKSTVPGVDRSVLHDLTVPYISGFESQKAVTTVLAAIDGKIANNKKLMTELKETARLIYDYWFTQFDFPDENGKPYRSSGGEMVWSDELKLEIPEGWQAGILGTVCKYADETVAASALNAQTYISLDNMLPNYGGITASEYCPTDGACKSYHAGDTLLGNIRPYFKKVFHASLDGGCSPDVLVIRATNDGQCFVYDTIARDCFIDYVVAGAKGTKMPRGDKDHIMRFKMAIPPQNIVNLYERLVIPIHEFRNHAATEDFELKTYVIGYFPCS